jgi:serine/threonine-protein kinase
VLGTAAYLSPEQAAGEGAGPQSDIYSLAVVSYQLLSGRLPYEANSLSELALRQQREAPAPLEGLNPEVPPTLSRAVAAGLSLDASARPADALAYGEALEAGAAGQEPFGETSATMHLGTAAATQALPARRRRGGAEPPPPPDGTSATQALPSRRAAEVEPLVPRRPAPAPPPPPVPAARDIGRPARRAERQAAPPSRGRIMRRRIAGFLAVLALICAGAAAAIIATSTSKTIVHFRKVVAKDVNDAVDTLHDIINKYTK